MRKIYKDILTVLMFGILSAIFVGVVLMLFGEPINYILIYTGSFLFGFVFDNIIDVFIDNYAEEQNKQKYKNIKLLSWLGLLMLIAVCIIL